MLTKIFAVIVALFFVSFTFVNLNVGAQTSSSPAQYSVVGKISLPSGYSMANTNTLPFAYLQTTNTIFVFAEKTATGAIYLLALTTAGVLRAPPIRFAGGVAGFYAYDQKDGRLFYAGGDTIWGFTQIVAVSTGSYAVVANYTIPAKYSSGYYESFVPISSFAYNPTNGVLYVTGWFQSTNYVVLFNARTNALIHAISLPYADYVIYDARNGLVYSLYNPAGSAVAAISGSRVVQRVSLLNEDQSWTGAAILNTQNSVLFVYSLNEAETNCPSVVGVNITTMSVLGNWSEGVPSYGDTLYPPSYADSRGDVYGNYVITGGGVVNWCDFPPGTTPTTSVEYAISTGSLVATSKINGGAASILSVPQLQANFVSLSGTAKAGYHVNVYSAVTGKLLAQIPGTLVPFSYNVASNIVYAAGANNFIYEIRG